MSDPWILACQFWLNSVYSGRTGFVDAPINGRTGWPTMFSLTRALQIELGIVVPSDNFGPGTSAAFASQIGTISSSTATSYGNVIGIVRTALWCKGYSGGYLAEPDSPEFLDWDNELEASINNLRADIGIGTGSISVKIMRSLLTMDAFRTLSNGHAQVRIVQQWMNSRYILRSDYPLVPCDGIFTRQVQIGLMFAVQYEIGMADGVANGNFGPGTQQGIRDYGAVGLGDSDSFRAMVSLFQASLIFNTYFSTPFNGSFDAATQASMQSFQSFVALGTTSIADYATWAALLISTGDPDRPVVAIDTSTPITAPAANALFASGYRIAGRYINGTDKRISPWEIEVMWNAGLQWFPIYQEYNNSPGWFSEQLGNEQGQRMVTRAKAMGLPSGSIVFLSVDFDATDEDIISVVIPHFLGVAHAVNGSQSYSVRVGVYGTRNVCERLRLEGLTQGSFVADMSTGWSGNLGFRHPQDWMYDQIKNTYVAHSGGSIEIDRDAASQRAESFGPGSLAATPLALDGLGNQVWQDLTWWRWSALCWLSEAIDGGQYESAYTRNDVLLNALQMPTYWTGSGFVQDIGWSVVFTPPLMHRTSAPVETIERMGQYWDRMVGTVGNDIFARPEPGPIGDVSHFAAVTRSHMNLGINHSTDDAVLVDMATWAGDLATAWDDYEITRVASGGTLDAYTWLRSHIAGSVPSSNGQNQFGEADLRADAWAYVVASNMLGAPNEPLENILRNLLIQNYNDPTAVIAAFRSGRFGTSKTRAIEIAKSVFTSPIVAQLSAQLGGNRLPGVQHPTTPLPNAVLDTELQAIAEAFVDVLWDAVGTWSQRF